MCVGKNTTSSPGFTLLHSAISLDLSEWGFSNFLPSAVLSHRTFVLLSTPEELSVASVNLVFWQPLVCFWGISFVLTLNSHW